ncbi:MAG: hypothetical protein MCSN_3670 [Candidatus Microsyncoccus archaeolyticus]|jgi:hypothetical protein|nr:MAG: hypothetical protein MCSN_3670 [Candidatus Parcubacteria bacterium]
MNQKKKIKLTSNILTFLLISLVGIYVFQVIESGKTNYNIGQNQEELTLLEEETSNLKLTASKTSNLNNIESKVKELGYAKMGRIDFITIPSSSVAIND